MAFWDKLRGNKKQTVCNLWIGSSPTSMTPVDDPEGLGEYQLAIDRLLREESPSLIYLRSDDPEDLSVVRKALEYLAWTGGEIAVAEQIPDEEIAETFGVSVAHYRAAVKDPDGPMVSFG